jgi:HupE / UreJ protein
MAHRVGAVMAFLLLFSVVLPAHTIDYDAAKLSRNADTWTYIQLGFTHIVPYGWDHVLFVLSIFFLSPKLSTVLWQATAFTIAHSITLGLAMYGYIRPLPEVIEPIIALSIFFVAMENLLVKELKPARVVIVFMFGLVHGMGFAGVLSELGLPADAYLSGLLSFNVGVELGQIAVILSAWLIAGKWFSGEPWYRRYIVNPASGAIALIALYWTIERTFWS